MEVASPEAEQAIHATEPQKIIGAFVRTDNLLNERELTAIQDYFQENVFWKYGWKSASDKMTFGHWNHDILKTPRSNQDDYEHVLQSDPTLEPIKAVWDKLKENFLQGHQLVRCYANAHTYGVEGYPHVDSRRPGNFTAILYVNPGWKPEWAGETVFFDEHQDIAQAVMPKPGRMVIFDNRIMHAARGVTRVCPAIRVTLMFKTKMKDAESDDHEFYDDAS
jgi:Rps23 Pro-64 3,4-dihydroxylase Tpa1-like proline 4-hydroxylase